MHRKDDAYGPLDGNVIMAHLNHLVFATLNQICGYSPATLFVHVMFRVFDVYIKFAFMSVSVF